MKLARTTFFVICTNNFGDTGQRYRQRSRRNAVAFNIRKPSARLVARWHVCPQTRRLECSWSLEPPGASDDWLCQYTMQRRRGSSRCLRLHRPSGNRFPLSVTSICDAEKRCDLTTMRTLSEPL
jgi:hypothetical protein